MNKTTRQTVDHKGRIKIPSQFRKSGQDATFVLTRGRENGLYIFPLGEWAEIEKRLHALPVTQPQTRHFLRILTTQATRLAVDQQGRITIPRVLLDLAQIQTDVLIVDTHEDYLELRSPDSR